MNNLQKSIDHEFSMDIARECHNLWKKEKYLDVILTKAYNLHKTYVRKGMLLEGQGESIGKIAYFSGKAYRGMGALGCSFNRARGVGLLMEENLMCTTLKECGLDEKTKPIRLKGLTANTYTLVCRVSGTFLEIGLLGDDDSYVNLSSNWSTRLTENFVE